MKYRGNLLETGTMFVFGLLFIGILLGAGVIAVTAMTPAVAGASASAQQNATSPIVQGTFGNATNGMANLSAQFPTLGTIAGVALIITVLFLAIGGYLMSKRE